MKKNISITLAMIISLIGIRLLNNYSLYLSDVTEVICADCPKSNIKIQNTGFLLFDPMEKIRYNPIANEIKVVHIFNLTYPNVYYIINSRRTTNKIKGALFSTELPVGLTIIRIRSNGAIIVKSNGTLSQNEKKITDCFAEDFSDLSLPVLNGKISNNIESSFADRQYVYNEKIKLLIFYFFLASILLAVLSKFGCNVKLGFLYYLLMLYFYEQMYYFVVFFNLRIFPDVLLSVSSKLFISGFFGFCIYEIVCGVKEIKKFTFQDVLLSLFFILFPIITYY